MSIFILLLVAFFYLLHRINSLEQTITRQKQPVPIVHAVIQNIPKQAPIPDPIFGPTPPPVQPTVQKHDTNAEFAFGTKAFTSIGIIALLTGIGFFLRYAFENELITETMRVVLGFVGGLIVSGIGVYLQKKYTSYGRALIGGGLGIMYISIFAAYSFYDLLSTLPTFLILLILTAAGVWASIRYNSQALVSYSFFGAFLIPLMLPLSITPHAYFLYTLLFSVSVLAVAKFKSWPALTLLSILATSILITKWIGDGYDQTLLSVGLIYTTVIFLTYLAASLLSLLKRDGLHKEIYGVLMYAVPFCYFALSLMMVEGKNQVTILSFSLGIFYIALSTLIRKLDKTLSNGLLFVSVPFIGTAISLYFKGSTAAILLAFQAMVTVFMGVTFQSIINRIGGMVIAFIAFVSTFFQFDISDEALLILNERTLTLALIAFAFLIIWYVYRFLATNDAEFSKEEKVSGRSLGASFAFIITTAWISAELFHFFKEDFTLYLPFCLILVVIFSVAFSYLVKDGIFRYLAYILFSFAVLIEAIFNEGKTIEVVIGLITALVSAYIGLLISHNKSEISSTEYTLKSPFIALSNIIVLFIVSREILDYFNQKANAASLENIKRLVLSGFWLGYGMISLIVGIAWHSIVARYFAIFLFGISIIKIFLYDTANLSDVYRFISFISLGIILLISGFAYYKFKSRIIDFVKTS